MNKKALVIGGTSGIGFSISKLFAQKNYDVTIVSSNKQNLETALIDLKKINTNCSYIKCDLKIETDVDNLEKTILKEGDNIECVVLCSCIGLFGKFNDLNKEHFLNYFQTFVVSYLKILKTIFDSKNNKTRVIYLSSYAAHFNLPNYNIYSFIKLTIDNFLEKIRSENEKGRLLTVYPGSVNTNFDLNSERIGNFKFRESKNKKSAIYTAEKIFKSYENYNNYLHANILMKFLFFFKDIITKLLNYFLRFFY